MLWALTDGEKQLAQPKARGLCPVCGGEVIAKCGKIVSWHWAHKKCDCDPWYEPESEWHIQWKQQFPKEWQEVVIGNHRADVKTPSGVIELQNSSLTSSEIEEREVFYGRMIWVVNAEKFKNNLFEVTPNVWRTDYIRSKKQPEWMLFPRPPLVVQEFKNKWGFSEAFPGCIGTFREEVQQQYQADKKAAEAAYKKWKMHPSVISKIDEYDSYIKHRKSHSMHFRWERPRKTWLNANKKVYLDFGSSKLFLIASTSKNRYTFIKTKPMSKEFFLRQLLR